MSNKPTKFFHSFQEFLAANANTNWCGLDKFWILHKDGKWICYFEPEWWENDPTTNRLVTYAWDPQEPEYDRMRWVQNFYFNQ